MTYICSVLSSDGTSYTVSNTVLDSDGNSFDVSSIVLDSDGNMFTVCSETSTGGSNTPYPFEMTPEIREEEDIALMFAREYMKRVH